MKRTAAVLAGLVAASAAILGAQSLQPSPQFAASMALATALHGKDPAKVMALVAPEGIVFVPGKGPLKGADLKGALEELAQNQDVKVAFSSLGSGGADQLGYDSGTYDMTILTRDGKKVRDRGGYVLVLRPGDDGQWLVLRLGLSSNGPPPPPLPPTAPFDPTGGSLPSPSPSPSPTPRP